MMLHYTLFTIAVIVLGVCIAAYAAHHNVGTQRKQNH
jgi:hypothetical protein